MMTSTAGFEDESLPLPVEKMPDCWKDDMRMNSLFSPFRQRTVNPLDWDAKIKFWKSLISDWCLYKNSPSFTIPDLRRAFQRDGRSPLCFPTVIDTMLRNNELCLYSDFVTITPQKSWSAWTVDVVLKKPLLWSFNKVKDSIVPVSQTKEEDYVHLAAAKSQGETLYAAISDSHKGQLLDFVELEALCGERMKNIKDFTIAVHWLRREGKIAVTHATEGPGGLMLVKLATPTDHQTIISELDLGVYALKRNENALTRHIEQLEKEKVNAVQEAKVYLSKGMRQVAKSCLRKKHELEKCIDKRTSALENVHLLLSRIREAETDSKVLDAYKAGVAALKTTFKEAGLTEDSVAHTVDDIEEVLDIHQEIQNTLSQPIGSLVDEDLEGELAALLLSDTAGSPPPDAPSPGRSSKKQETDLEDRLKALRSNLPEPPTNLPSLQKGTRPKLTQNKPLQL